MVRKGATKAAGKKRATHKHASMPTEPGVGDVMPAAPLPRTWWVLGGQLLAGPYPGDLDPAIAESKLDAILAAGIRTFVCLQEERECGYGGVPFADYRPVINRLAKKRRIEVTFTRMAIADMGVTDKKAMTRILDTIDEAIADNKPVYLHCWGGHGRTSTVVGCLLVRHGLTGEEALAQITALRAADAYMRGKPAPQTRQQCEMVRHWQTIE